MTDYVLVWTTLAADADVASFARTLVDERLAACVSAFPPMDSFYRWKGETQTDRERQLVIKTTAARVPALKARLGTLHPYDVPEVLVTPVVDGAQGYLAWLRESIDGGD